MHDLNDIGPVILATDLDGTFLGGAEEDRLALYRWLEGRPSDTPLIFVTGRDLPFIRELVETTPVPKPDFIIGDVGTTIAGGGGLEPMPALEQHIAEAWADRGEEVRRLLEGEPGIRPQDTPFRHRMSYYYEPDALRRETVEKIEAAGFDCLLSANLYLDVLPKGISKGPTLDHLVAQLGLNEGAILTAGDTLNDFSLLATRFKGVAVGNSEEALVKRIADLPNLYHAKGHGCAGIAEAVHHYFGNGGGTS